MSDPLQTVRQAFDLDDATFKAIVLGFRSEYESGLKTASASGLATMIPSYVTTLPTGKETGTYLALDLGGSTLRVSAVELSGSNRVNVTEVRRQIAPNDPMRTTDSVTFFDWIADAVVELLQKIGRGNSHNEDTLSLGVCWSFPVDQISISSGKILRMGKGFTIDGVQGQDFSTLFNEAFSRKGVNVKVAALINDTVGTLVAHAYTNPKTRVGFIYGTGVNAAYPEKTSAMVKLNGSSHTCSEDTEMLVNTEIDIFGSDAYLPLNKYDRELDANHSQPEFQLYEKMMSGACIGELVRLACLDLIKEEHLFNGHRPEEFSTAMEFGTAITSDVEGRINDTIELRFDHFKELFHFEDAYQVELQDLKAFTEVCQFVSNRAARLAGAAIASLIEQQTGVLDGTDDIVIGVNGSTYEKYPKMHERICESLSSWFTPETYKRIHVELATDGGSIGGALIAMLAEKDERINRDIQKKPTKPKTLPKQVASSNQPPPPPSLLGCLFAWLPSRGHRSKKEETLVDESIHVHEEPKL